MTQKTLITGGHLLPALAITEALVEHKEAVVFVGRKHAFTDKSGLSLEHRLLSTHPGVKYYTLQTGRLSRTLDLTLLTGSLETFKAIFRAYRILQTERISRIISFGGYLSVPIVLAGVAHSLPIYLHEQTIAPGLANRWLAKLATKVLVTFPESARFFPKTKTECLGNEAE